MAALTVKSKLPDVEANKPRRTIQIYSLMKASHTATDITRLLVDMSLINDVSLLMFKCE